MFFLKYLPFKKQSSNSKFLTNDTSILPLEIWSHIFLYLNKLDLERVAPTSKLFNTLAKKYIKNASYPERDYTKLECEKSKTQEIAYINPVLSLITTNSGYAFVSTANGSTAIWDTNKNVILKTFKLKQIRNCLHYEDDIVIYNTYESSNFNLYNLGTLSRIEILPKHTELITAIISLPDKNIITGSLDKTIRIWDMKSNDQIKVIDTDDKIYTLALLPNNRLASGHQDGTICIWDLKTNLCTQTFGNHFLGVKSLTALPNGKLLSHGENNDIKIWNPKTGQLCFSYKGGLCDKYVHLGHGIIAISQRVYPWHVSNKLKEYSIIVWDSNNDTVVHTLKGHKDLVCALLRLNKSTIASYSLDSTIRFWDTTKGSLIGFISTISGTNLALLDNGQMISGDLSGRAHAWYFPVKGP